MKNTCSIADCENRVRTRGWCEKHYMRVVRHGDPTYEVRRPEFCTVPDCDRKAEARGYCHTHYTRWWVSGDVKAAKPLPDKRPTVCSVEDCDNAPRSRGFCLKHWQRNHVHGDPNVVLLVHGGTDIGYNSAHQRVYRARGKASDHLCEHCAKPATDWAYDHSDPEERIDGADPKRRPFSLDATHYMSLCRTCHRRFDLLT